MGEAYRQRTRVEPAPSAAEEHRARTGQLVAELTAQRRELARQFSERKPQPLPATSSPGFSPSRTRCPCGG